VIKQANYQLKHQVQTQNIAGGN